jgi:hypothetical protein
MVTDLIILRLERSRIMIIKVTKVVKSLLQIVSHNVHIEAQHESDKTSQIELLVQYLIRNVIELSVNIASKLEKREEANYAVSFVSLDQDEDELSANPYLLNTEKLRDFEISQYDFEELQEILPPFYGKWIVTSRNAGEHYGRTNIAIDEKSATSSCIIAEIVRLLSDSKDKTLVRAQELLELPAGSGALKDKQYISGYLWVMMKQNSGDNHGHAYISRFVINLKTGRIASGSSLSVKIEDRSREREITNNRSNHSRDGYER